MNVYQVIYRFPMNHEVQPVGKMVTCAKSPEHARYKTAVALRVMGHQTEIHKDARELGECDVRSARE